MNAPLPGRPVAKGEAFTQLIAGLVGASEAAEVRQVLAGPLHLASPLRIGDLLILVGPAPDDPTRLNVSLQNAATMNPPLVIWTVP